MSNVPTPSRCLFALQSATSELNETKGKRMNKCYNAQNYFVFTNAKERRCARIIIIIVVVVVIIIKLIFFQKFSFLFLLLLACGVSIRQKSQSIHLWHNMLDALCVCVEQKEHNLINSWFEKKNVRRCLMYYHEIVEPTANNESQNEQNRKVDVYTHDFAAGWHRRAHTHFLGILNIWAYARRETIVGSHVLACDVGTAERAHIFHDARYLCSVRLFAAWELVEMRPDRAGVFALRGIATLIAACNR